MKRAKIGMLGAGFVCDLYMNSLKYVRDHDVVIVFSQYEHDAKAFAKKWGIPEYTASMDDVFQHGEVELVVIGVPHHLHVNAVSGAAGAGKAVVCTKPLGRNAQEARQCLQAVQSAGVWHAYAETEIFSPAMMRAKELADSGALGKIYWIRFREAHSQIHKFARDPELNGGGPLRGLGCHGVAVGRWFFGGAVPKEVFAWGDRIARDDVETEDNGIMLIRFEQGEMAQVEVSWGHKAGLDTRAEIHGTEGYVATDVTGVTGIKAFTIEPAGYVVEKAGLDRGWIFPVPDEAISYGFHNEMDHFVHAFINGEQPKQNLRDGLIDNSVIDAAYRSIESGHWEKVVIPGN